MKELGLEEGQVKTRKNDFSGVFFLGQTNVLNTKAPARFTKLFFGWYQLKDLIIFLFCWKKLFIIKVRLE